MDLYQPTFLGTYNGVQLAAAVENALRDGFGDDKKIKLLPDVDNKFTVDIKKTSGDGKSTGLLTPIEVDIHTTIVESNVNTIKDGSLDAFLVHPNSYNRWLKQVFTSCERRRR